jgi:hydrogenase maturation factor
MKIQVKKITPKMAADMLEKHLNPVNQRKQSQSVIESYARAMRAGQWVLTHQGIAIDTNGELVDGQHRLSAIVASGATVEMLVTTEIPTTANGGLVIDAIDRGHERKVGAQLHMRHGVSNGSLYAAVARGVLWLCASSQKLMVGKFSVGAALKVAEYYGAEIDYCMANRSREYRVRNASVITACAFAMKAYPAQMQAFYDRMTTDEGHRKGDPALTCRRWLMDGKDKTGTLIEYRAVLTCAMKHVKAEKLQKLYDTQHGFDFFLAPQTQTVQKVLKSCGYVW